MSNSINHKNHFRVAIYYAPDIDHVFWKLGTSWLGRCPARQITLDQPPISGVDVETFRNVTRSARRYGWHATLKAPFQLHESGRLSALHDQMAIFAKSNLKLHLPQLVVRRSGNFLALMLSEPSQLLQNFASQCVREFHPYARPLSDADLARRRNVDLSAEQDQLLQTWGYPYVMDEFSLHMTLTDDLTDLSDVQVFNIIEKAQEWFAPILDAPFEIDALSLFIEPIAGGDFIWADRYPLQK